MLHDKQMVVKHVRKREKPIPGKTQHVFQHNNIPMEIVYNGNRYEEQYGERS